MKFGDYVKQLLPFFGSDRAVEDARVTRNELVGVAIPSYELAMEVFKTNLKSARVVGYAKKYAALVGPHKNTFVFDILERLKKLIKVLDAIDGELAKGFEARVVADAITLHKANVLRVLECTGFLSKYSISLLNAIYVEETAAYGGVHQNAPDMTAGELARLDKFFIDFCQTLKAVSDIVAPVAVFKAIPESKISDMDSLREVFGDRRVDPFNLFTTSNFKGNPIYFVRSLIAEWQMDRYKHTQEQKKLLELRLLHLQRRQQNNPDAGLERDIEITSGRVATLAEKLRKQEESFA